MNTEQNVGEAITKKLNKKQLSILDTIIDEAQMYFEDEVIFRHFSDIGLKEFEKITFDIEEIKIDSVVLTPVAVLSMKTTIPVRTFKLWTDILNEEDYDLETVREDFAYVIGFFISMMDVEEVGKHFNKVEIESILNSTLAFFKALIKRLTEEKLKELL